jgi:hypothetical protein
VNKTGSIWSRARHAILIAVAVAAVLALLAIRLSISVAGHETPAWWEIPIIAMIGVGFWLGAHRLIGPLLDRILHGGRQSTPAPARPEDSQYSDEFPEEIT